jgi:hypothetical protein
MDEAWYIVEQQIRDRLTEARAAARIQTLTQKLAPTARHPNVVGITIVRLANWVLARAMRSPVDLSRALADVPVTTTRCESAAAKGRRHVIGGRPTSDQPFAGKRAL